MSIFEPLFTDKKHHKNIKDVLTEFVCKKIVKKKSSLKRISVSLYSYYVMEKMRQEKKGKNFSVVEKKTIHS